MRWFFGFMLATSVIATQIPTARAQDSLNAFGGYPAGITSNSPYGFYPGGYVQTNRTYSTPNGYATVPGVTYYSSGFYGGTPGTTIYGPGVNFSSPNAAAYGYPSATYSNYRYYTQGTGYSVYTRRRGIFGPRAYRY